MKAIDIANWFLWKNSVSKAEEEYDDNYDIYEGLTHLKIQKLVYYAFGVYTAVYEKPLFKEKIYAWQHGPVVREVYDELCDYGKSEIPFDTDNADAVAKIFEDDEIAQVLGIVYDNYAGYTAWQLREKTHEPGSPWQITVDTKGMRKEIDKRLIENYFRENIVAD